MRIKCYAGLGYSAEETQKLIDAGVIKGARSVRIYRFGVSIGLVLHPAIMSAEIRVVFSRTARHRALVLFCVKARL